MLCSRYNTLSTDPHAPSYARAYASLLLCFRKGSARRLLGGVVFWGRSSRGAIRPLCLVCLLLLTPAPVLPLDFGLSLTKCDLCAVAPNLTSTTKLNSIVCCFSLLSCRRKHTHVVRVPAAASTTSTTPATNTATTLPFCAPAKSWNNSSDPVPKSAVRRVATLAMAALAKRRLPAVHHISWADTSSVCCLCPGQRIVLSPGSGRSRRPAGKHVELYGGSATLTAADRSADAAQ